MRSARSPLASRYAFAMAGQTNSFAIRFAWTQKPSPVSGPVSPSGGAGPEGRGEPPKRTDRLSGTTGGDTGMEEAQLGLGVWSAPSMGEAGMEWPRSGGNAGA